jgi:opacity protein-like surface antigen
MKTAFLLCLATVAMVGWSASISLAAAGPYLTLQGGATWLEDAGIDYDGVPSSDFSLEAEFDTGFNLGVAAGYDYGPARLEAEVAYRQNDIDKFNGQFEGFGFEGSADGDVSATSLMVNAYWDIPTGSPITPYIGGGVGFANVSVNDVELEVFGERFDLADDDDNVFAYQLAAGIAFDINPNLALDLGYRYFATDDPELEDEFGDDFETEYDSHNVSLGLRFIF